MAKKPDPFMPPVSLLVKLGSLVVHYQELASSDGHEFDRSAIDQLEADPDVKDWLTVMASKGLLPVKRK